MEKYTASYGKAKNSFVFQNMLGTDQKQSKYYGVYCVVKNILQRGFPTHPSIYLQDALGAIDHQADSIEPLLLLSAEKPKWNNTIKGDDENDDYPGEVFYNIIIPKYLPDFTCIQQLMIPEALITDILPNCSEQFMNQMVDFYIPQAKLVIEVDGFQHNDALQYKVDNQRDRHFKKFGIQVIRISTRSIRNEDEHLLRSMQQIESILSNSESINEYQKIYLDSHYYEDHQLRIKYDTVLRFQLLIISLLQKGIIDITDEKWHFNLTCNSLDGFKLFKLAYRDTLLWIKHCCQLQELPVHKPLLKLTQKSTLGIQIDFNIYKRWTDENKQKQDVIFIRNDYYDYQDYFCVSTSDSIKYNISFEKDSPSISSVYFLLENIFGYKKFNDGQLPIIIQALNKLDTIGILPTGAGKSLCYQFCCLLQPCINFVVSPILSLIYDQKQNLDEFGITRTSYITSDKSAEEKFQIMQDFGQGKYLIIWISPERFQVQRFRDALGKINQEKNMAYAVLDEVHCLSEWGHDFRTSYLNLVKTIHRYCPETTLMGLTATASNFVLEDLKKEFEVDSNSIKSVTTMIRKELRFHIKKTEFRGKYNELLNTLTSLKTQHETDIFQPNGSHSICGTIFTTNKGGRNGCIEIAQKLSKEYNTTIKAYHGDLGEEKIKLQNAYKNNDFTLLTATKSFGMGVNKKNIRYTIHYGLPWSVEAFYQEAGRAGRDGDKSKISDCTIIYEPEICDKNVIDQLFSPSTDITEISELRKSLKCDLSQIMFLWTLNNLGIDEDLSQMRWLMNKLSMSKSDIITCDEKHKKSQVEKAIYRLTVLGLIEDWTIESWDETSAIIKVIQCEFSIQSVRDRLFEYIHRYDPAFSEENPNQRYSKYLDILHNENLKEYTRYMKMLLQWSYDNIVYSRKQAIKNMIDVCDTIDDSDSFQAYIDNYFKFSDVTILLDNVVYHPNDFYIWFEVFYTYRKSEDMRAERIMITKPGAEALLVSLQRYLESYQFNTGLNFISAVLRLICNKFDNSEGIDRLTDAFNVIDGWDFAERDSIVNQLLLLHEVIDERNKEILGEFLIGRYPEKAKMVHEKLHDFASLSVALKQSVIRLQNIKESVKWQT